jgi:hypothetical protein
MGHRLDIRQTADGTHVKRGDLSKLTTTLTRWPSFALGQHHPSHHGVQPVLVLHNAIVRSFPPRGNQEGDGDHRVHSMCDGDANPPSPCVVRLYATLAGACAGTSNTWHMDLLPDDMKHQDRLNADHHHPMLGETRIIDVFCPTSWQGHAHPSRESAGRPPRSRVHAPNPCAIPNPEMPDRRVRPTMPCIRHDPPSARPPAWGIPNHRMAVST